MDIHDGQRTESSAVRQLIRHAATVFPPMVQR
jgi:hypothetical protein